MNYPKSNFSKRRRKAYGNILDSILFFSLMLVASSVVYVGINGTIDKMNDRADYLYEYASYANDAILSSTVFEVHYANDTMEFVLRDRTVSFLIGYRFELNSLGYNCTSIDEIIKMKYGLGIKDDYRWAMHAEFATSELFISHDVKNHTDLPKDSAFAIDEIVVSGKRAYVTLYVWR
ncbi:MAG: hypothetical protein QXT63_08270 [Thermoplasmata archaeon]